MRTAVRLLVVAIITIHGLIHLLGTVKGFGWADVTALKEPIGRGSGLVWLVAGVLVVASGVLLAGNVHWWWIVAIIAAVVSQAVILTSWNDAKAGHGGKRHTRARGRLRRHRRRPDHATALSRWVQLSEARDYKALDWVQECAAHAGLMLGGPCHVPNLVAPLRGLPCEGH
jgi:hypothetical protein